jgi:hypothetical protein
MQKELHIQLGSEATGFSSLFRAFALLALALASASCGSTRSSAIVGIEPGNYFTQFSLRVHKNRCYSTNYRGEASELIPINTQVEYVGTQRRSLKMLFQDGRSFTFDHVAKHSRDTVAESFTNFFGATQVDISAFTQEEQAHIRLGKAANGMSRAAVLAAMGPPPASTNPSLELNIWTYEASRFFAKIRINFDENGQVVGLTQ